MDNNTKRSPSSMGEQWLPVPVRLVEAIYEAPTPQRRAWAIAYLLIWLVVFHRTRKGSRSSMAEVEAWTLTKSRQRTVKARADALACLEKWTDRGPEVDRKRTEGNQVEPATQRTSGPEVDEKRTARERAKLQTTNSQDYTSIWARLEAIRTEANPKARPLKLTSGRRRALGARLKEHTAEELLTVWRWWQTSQHDRAVWLRSKCTVDTILRPSNFPGYLDLASASPTTKTAADAEQVWNLLIDAMGRVGSRRLPTPADIPALDAGTITRAIAALGGPGRWSTLCQTHSRELQFRVRPQFVKTWGVSHV